MQHIFYFLLLVLFSAILPNTGLARHHAVPSQALRVVPGIERAAEYSAVLAGQRLGLLTNQTGVDGNLKSSVDILREQYDLAAVFVPEHGFYGAVAAGQQLHDSRMGGITVFSLYGASKRPTPEMLEQIDVLCVDLQDVGVRHYTYVSTMACAMEACAAAGKPVVVFDRPNPLGGKIEGPVLKPAHKSFIGLYEIPLRHGLTIGEYARYINSVYSIGCDLTVIPMQGWRRQMLWRDTGLPWVSTSPLIPTAETALYYAVTGMGGDTCLSVGEATAKPFYYLAAPFADENRLVEALRALHLPGVAFRPAAFMPRWGKYEGELVKGAEIYLLDPGEVNLPELGYRLVWTFRQLYPEQFTFASRGQASGFKVDIALGEDSLRNGEVPEQAFARWTQECAAFQARAKAYWLYEE